MKIRDFLIRLVINAVALWVVVLLFPGISITDGSFFTLVLAGLVFGLLNAFLRPVVTLIASPLIVATFGIASIVIDIILLMLTVLLVPTFSVDSAIGFGSLIVGGIFLGLINNSFDVVGRRLEDMRRQRRQQEFERNRKIPRR